MKKKIIMMMCIFIIVNAKAQTVTLDLSSPVKNYTQTIQPQTISNVILTNRSIVPEVVYSLDIKKEHVDILPIQISGFLASGIAGCASLSTAKGKLLAETDETKIPSLVKDLKAEILKADPSTCKPEMEKSEIAILSTTVNTPLIVPVTIEQNYKVTITVTKTDGTKWTFVFAAEGVSHSKIYYGFSYLFSNALTSFPTYFSKADTGSSYIITKSNSTTKNVLKNISPTFMYSYLFFKNPDAPFKFGFTGGFMLDLSNPSVLFSPSLVIGDNISLNSGIAFTQKSQLKGQYAEGDRIMSNLDFDQMHDKIWTYDLFFSIGFHFNNNPFKKAATTPAETTTP